MPERTEEKSPHRLLQKIITKRQSSSGCRKIIVIGDCILDRYITGETNRLSREAPIPVLSQQSDYSCAGGAANVACNLAAAGIPVLLIGIVGTDIAGQELQEKLAAYPDLQPAILVDPEHKTIVKTRFVSGGQQMFRFDREHHNRNSLTIASAAAVNNILTQQLPDCAAVVFSDYGYGVINPDLLQRITAQTAQHGIATILDPRAHDFSCYRGVDYLTPNLAELALATYNSGINQGGAAASDQQQQRLMTAGQAICKQLRLKAMLVTKGGQGMSLLQKGKQIDQPAQPRHVFDATGAGDCVVAWFAIALACGLSARQGMILANLAGGLAVEVLGAAILGISDMLRAVRLPHASHNHKFHDSASLPYKLEQWRQRSLTIGFTNGCFDIIHSGHVAQLAFARQHCDRLVVAVNADATVAKLKGAGKPINSLEARCHVLAALTDVDAVCSFSEDTAIEIIRQVNPNVYIKGGDYDIETLPEAKHVLATGGKCVTAPYVTGFSSSATIATIIKRANSLG